MSRRYAPWLWLLLGLFCLRVLGQLAVALFSPSFLPPMEDWYSGLLPYRPLLISQILIVLLYGKVCVDFTRGRGFFAKPRRRLGAALRVFGALYLGVMVIRCVLTRRLLIPVLFHWILAAFLLVAAHYHLRHDVE